VEAAKVFWQALAGIAAEQVLAPETFNPNANVDGIAAAQTIETVIAVQISENRINSTPKSPRCCSM